MLLLIPSYATVLNWLTDGCPIAGLFVGAYYHYAVFVWRWISSVVLRSVSAIVQLAELCFFCLCFADVES